MPGSLPPSSACAHLHLSTGRAGGYKHTLSRQRSATDDQPRLQRVLLRAHALAALLGPPSSLPVTCDTSAAPAWWTVALPFARPFSSLGQKLRDARCTLYLSEVCYATTVIAALVHALNLISFATFTGFLLFSRACESLLVLEYSRREVVPVHVLIRQVTLILVPMFVLTRECKLHPADGKRERSTRWAAAGLR